VFFYNSISDTFGKIMAGKMREICKEIWGRLLDEIRTCLQKVL